MPLLLHIDCFYQQKMSDSRREQQKIISHSMMDSKNRMNMHSLEALGRRKVGVSKQQYKKIFSLSRQRENMPGPGSYKLASIFNRNGGFTISQAKQQKSREIKPDPWSYIPKELNFKPKSPSAMIGTERRNDKKKNIPGPADYHTNSTVLFHNSRRPIIGTEVRVSPLKITPGPTDYDTYKAEKLTKDHKSIVIGTEKRNSRPTSQSPGPNQYPLTGRFQANVKSKKGYSMGQRLRIKTESDSPVDYFRYDNSKDIVMNRAPAFTIKKSRIKALFETLGPGPAQYQHLERLQNKGITIPRSPRKLHEQNNYSISPFDYKVSYASQSPAYSIPRSIDAKQKIERMPGPADYYPKESETHKFKQIGIGYGSKTNFVKQQQSPGPGNYNIDLKQHRKGYTMSRQDRALQSSRSNSPGPADYYIDYSIFQKSLPKRT